MKHLGDITKISGYEVPVVDVIIGGSPCQDLSVAGKRAGLAGERSGLFMEQVRIAKEMRENDIRNGRSGFDVRPRFLVWENVAGAFSSNGGEDFRAVLEEICRIAEPGVSIPRPANGKWDTKGLIVGDTWSVGYRTMDAQYWGVPQRRRRIALVADFASPFLGEWLFEKVLPFAEGVPGHPQSCGTEREEAGDEMSDPVQGADETGAHVRGGCFAADIRNGSTDSEVNGEPAVAYGISSYDSNAMKSDNPESGFYEADTARTLDNNGGNPACNQGGMAICYPEKARAITSRFDSSPCLDRGQNVVCYDARGNGNGDTAPTITGDHQDRVTDYTAVVCSQSVNVERERERERDEHRGGHIQCDGDRGRGGFADFRRNEQFDRVGFESDLCYSGTNIGGQAECFTDGAAYTLKAETTNIVCCKVKKDAR